MNLVARLRAGYRPSMADKLRTCTHVLELDEMLRSLKAQGHRLTTDEVKAAEACREMLTDKGGRR